MPPDPLLPRVAASDVEAVRECVERYQGLIWWLARQMAGNEDAEDAVQEIFIDLWKSAERYDPKRSSESAFVSMIARRRLIDRRRRSARRPEIHTLEADHHRLAGSDSRQVEHVAEAALAARALRRLERKERDVLLLSVYYGMSHREIAEEVSMPLGTVKTYVRRGLQRVREALTRQPADARGAAR